MNILTLKITVGGGSGEIDYEAIYQFYKKEIKKVVREQYLEQAIIPEHFSDVQYADSSFEEYKDKVGIWRGDATDNDLPLFTVFGKSNENNSIYFGRYRYVEVEII